MKRFHHRPRPRSEKVYIYGKHAVMEALLNAPHVVRKVLILEEMYEGELKAALHKAGTPLTFLKPKEASRMVGEDATHQGVIGVIDPDGLQTDLSSFAKELRPTSDTILVILDELTDPHNVGAIIRSAAAFGASGVLMPTHNQAPITGAVVKTSAGMVFRLPIVSIGNVNYAIDKLKEMGFRTYALDMSGSTSLRDEKFDLPSLFIVGNEGRGIRDKTMERCDVSLRIPMDARCESLNASVSAAIVLYEWSRQHGTNLK